MAPTSPQEPSAQHSPGAAAPLETPALIPQFGESFLDRLVAHETGRRLRDQFKTRSWGLPFSLGMAVFCTGLATGRYTAWWERGLWGVLALSFVWQPVAHLRSR